MEEKEKCGIKDKQQVRNNSSGKEADTLNFVGCLNPSPCLKTISISIEKTAYDYQGQ
jgi:hypothetical protein